MGVRILLLPGTYDCKNLGDLAMLQVAISRLQRQLPENRIRVLTSDSETLKRHCPDIDWVPTETWRRWRTAKILPRWLWREAEARFRRHQPAFFVKLWRLKAALLRGKYLSDRRFLEEIDDADAVFVSGCGMITDSFCEASLHVLELLRIAIERRVATALFSQGVGPLENAAALKRAREVLPRVKAIFVRESRTSPSLLQTCGVGLNRITFTGDDAVEMAWAVRPEVSGPQLGFNLRVAPYSGIGEETLAAMRRVLAAKARNSGACLLGIPITRGDTDCDLQTNERILRDFGSPANTGADIDTPIKAIGRAAACRLVVTGSYHLGVFALSQGIPAVCIARNLYYTNKFLGLADAFGPGCVVLQADEPRFESSLTESVNYLWQQAPGLRRSLLERAERQVSLANKAYDRLLAWFRDKHRQNLAAA